MYGGRHGGKTELPELEAAEEADELLVIEKSDGKRREAANRDALIPAHPATNKSVASGRQGPESPEVPGVAGVPEPEPKAEPTRTHDDESFEWFDEMPRGGELRARVPGFKRSVPVPLKHTDVKAQISAYIASVRLEQQYHNPYCEKIEAVYVFPLPQNAAVRDFVMVIGDRRIRGIIREKEEARRIYEHARRQGYAASLLSQDRPNIFTQKVANIEPGKQIDINITYFHTLKYEKGVYEFVFPMVVGPRFNPPGYRDGVGAVGAGSYNKSPQATEVQYLRPHEVSSHDVSLEVDIDAGQRICEIESPSHVIDVQERCKRGARVRLARGDRIPNKDFVLRYKVASQKIQTALITHRDESGGYFTLVIQPPDSLADYAAPPREMIFVLDCSGSMSGAPIDYAKRALRECLRRLGPDDTFQIIRFSNNASQLGPRPVPATRHNIEQGLRYVDSLHGSGGTMMIEGIRAALDFPHDPRRLRIVSFMTDGYIGNDREIIGEVRNRLRHSRVFSFGVGSSPNRYLLERMATVGRGAVAWVTLSDESYKLAQDLYRKVEHPALSDIEIDWGAMGASDVYPEVIPDLFVGKPVIVTGRFRGDGEVCVKIGGRVGCDRFNTAMELDFGGPRGRHDALPAVWARSKIADLYDRMTWSPDANMLATEIKNTALHYGLASAYTSFVAVDSMTRTKGSYGVTVPVPVPVPQGVRYDTTVDD